MLYTFNTHFTIFCDPIPPFIAVASRGLTSLGGATLLRKKKKKALKIVSMSGGWVFAKVSRSQEKSECSQHFFFFFELPLYLFILRSFV